MKDFEVSPLRFDFEQDFFGSKPSDLRFTTEVDTVGTAHGRNVIQILQRVTDAHWNSDMVVKRLLLQRGTSEYCAVYQQIYAAAQVDVHPARLIILDHRPVLMTLDQNGNATWNEEYWLLSDSGPIHLDLEKVNSRIAEELPKGDRLAIGPFDTRSLS